MVICPSELNRRAWHALCLLVLILACCCLQPLKAIAQETLQPGKTLTRPLPGGKTTSFTIRLMPDQFVDIAIEQRGAILSATLFDPEDHEVMEMDYPGGGFGPIFLSTIAALAGDYKLSIRSTNSWANPYDYAVTIRSLRTATPNDQALNAAQLKFSQARKDFRNRKINEALEGYQNSLKDWQTQNDRHWQAVTQYALAELHRNRNKTEYKACLSETIRILDLETLPDDWRLLASAFNDIGNVYSREDKQDEAIASFNRAMKLFADHGDRRGQASALGNLGAHHYNSGDFSLAREFFEKAAEFRRVENDKPGAANLVNNLAAISDKLGEPEQALAYATKALIDWQQVTEIRPADRSRVAAVLTNIATANDKLGRWNEAFEFYEKALNEYDPADPDRAQALDPQGELYAALGDFAKARECYEEALKSIAAAGIPDLNLKAGILVHRGQLHMAEGDILAALNDFEEARKIATEPRRLTNVLTNLGDALAVKGAITKAIEIYEKALKIQIESKDQRGQALALQKRGEARTKIGQMNEALADFNSALVLWKAVKDQRGAAATLNNIAVAERERGNTEAALARTAEAIQIIESLRSGISNRQLQVSYFAAQDNVYELDVDLKMQLGLKEKRADYLAAALESAEKSRARVLLDTLNEATISRGEISQDASSPLAKLKQERATLLTKLSAKNDARTRLLSRTYLPQQMTILDREISQLNDAADALEVKMRSLDPRFAGLTKPQPARLKEIQDELDTDTALIEYFLGEKRSYVWLVTRDSLEGYELPARTQIEALARRVYNSLSARGRDEKNETPGQKMERVAKEESDFNESSALLSQMILKQAGSRIAQKRLVVVADGALQTLPFGVLPAPANGTAAAPALLASNEVVSLPSASVLVLQRRELARRQPAPLKLAVIADPVFDINDARVSEAKLKNNRQKSSDSLQSSAYAVTTNQSFQTRAVNALGEAGGIRRLLYSEREASRIIIAAGTNQTLKAVNFDASRTTAMSPQLSRYRIIHLATHGVINLSHPELSGVLFSMVDERGKPTNGYLGLSEIYNLNLPADLVVLSACETGIGKEIKGEGLIALTRGFMHSGAERVVASLWKVDDHATASLMEEFYKQMFQKNLKPASALRAAQLTLSQQPGLRKPYFWAGFVLQGEWR